MGTRLLNLQKTVHALLLGPPGGGKGTIANKIIKDFSFLHLSTGDVLRHHVRTGTDVGNQAKDYMSRGSLVPDELMVGLVQHELQGKKQVPRLLLDGFPRTLKQAEALEPVVPLHIVINLQVPDATIIKRICNRWIHPGSGRTYAHDYNPPKKEGFDDVTGEPLIQREDDKEHVVMQRLSQYREMTEPLVQYYGAKGVLVSFAGTQSNVIYKDVEKYLSSLGLRAPVGEASPAAATA